MEKTLLVGSPNASSLWGCLLSARLSAELDTLRKALESHSKRSKYRQPNKRLPGEMAQRPCNIVKKRRRLGTGDNYEDRDLRYCRSHKTIPLR